ETVNGWTRTFAWEHGLPAQVLDQGSSGFAAEYGGFPFGAPTKVTDLETGLSARASLDAGGYPRQMTDFDGTRTTIERDLQERPKRITWAGYTWQMATSASNAMAGSSTCYDHTTAAPDGTV